MRYFTKLKGIKLQLTRCDSSKHREEISMQSDSDDSDKADFGLTTANTATINLGSIAAGSQHEIQLTYIIN